MLIRKGKQYPSHYGSSRMSRYRQDIADKKVCADCMGAAKGYAWSGGGQGVKDAIGTDRNVEKVSGSNGCRTGLQTECFPMRNPRAANGAR